MGLDITAYSNLRAVGDHTSGEWCDDENHVEAFAYDSFPDSFRGLPVLGTKPAGGSRFLWAGCYEPTEGTDTQAFQAGSYMGYSHWRLDLARQFNPAAMRLGPDGPELTKPDPDLPFFELIWFADNEGSIGELAAAELLADFQRHAIEYDPKGEIWWVESCREKYRSWTQAFELAAQGGLVRFH